MAPATNRGLPGFFAEYASAALRAHLAEATGARLVLLPGLVGGAEKVTDYPGLFDHIVRQLTEALQAR